MEKRIFLEEEKKSTHLKYKLTSKHNGLQKYSNNSRIKRRDIMPILLYQTT